jgi:molybdate transport system ATP-binding protein
MTHARLAKKIPPLSLDVEFELASGVTTLYGRPGSGRTLILDLLAGFADPTSGRILVDDAILFDRAAGVNISARLRRCGYIFQRDMLFPHMTLRRNLDFAARGRPRLERHRRVGEMLERFELGELAEVAPREAPGEVRLRAEAARALIGEPRLLLIDDCGIEEPLLTQIRAVSKAPILLVTGDLDLCCSAASQLLLLEGGRILQRGAPLEVIDRPDSIEVARLVGIGNLFPGTVAALDPGRNTSRLELEHFALTGPYIRGHFRGDRIWVGVDAAKLRVHSGEEPAGPNSVAAALVRVAERSRSVRLEFAYGITAEIPREEFARHKDNQSWQVEFPPDALRIL